MVNNRTVYILAVITVDTCLNSQESEWRNGARSLGVFGFYSIFEGCKDEKVNKTCTKSRNRPGAGDSRL
jgi:hypothetical protein